MDLKTFTRTFITPAPEIVDIREYFHKNDKSVFLGSDFGEKPVVEKFRFFINAYAKLFHTISRLYPTKFKELFSHGQFISPLGNLYLTLNGFYPTVQLLATPEQLAKWEKLTFEGRLVGAYAQTEIGHGSDVQSLQTTATYNKEKKCFVLHSPSIRSIKFWPGGLGIQSTHAVVQAQTYVEGKHYGLQTFVVPLRDPKTYKAYEGVDSGDVGPKLAYSWADNGYLRFTNYEIPRDHLLMKFIKVDEDGTVTSNVDKHAVKIGYGGMLGLRVALSKYFMVETYRAITIGWRNWKQADLLTAANKKTVLKGLSYVYTGFLTIDKMTAMHQTFNDNIKKDMKKALSDLAELHIVASGLKAYYSWELVRYLRECSVAQSLNSLRVMGTVELYGDIIAAPTYEGDNGVMLQQTARGLLKYLQHVESDEFNKVPESFKFLVELRGLLEKPEELKARFEKAGDLLNAGKIEEILDVISLFSVKEGFEKMKEHLMSGGKVNTVWNEKIQSAMIEMAYVVSKGLTFKMTRSVLEGLKSKGTIQKKDQELLEGMMLVYGLDLLEQSVNTACKFKVGAAPERLRELIYEAQEILLKRLDSNLEYIAESMPFFEEELYYVRDFKNWTPYEKKDDRVLESIQREAEVKRKYMNTFSKL